MIAKIIKWFLRGLSGFISIDTTSLKEELDKELKRMEKENGQKERNGN